MGCCPHASTMGARAVPTLAVDQWGCPGLDGGAALVCLAVYGLGSQAIAKSIPLACYWTLAGLFLAVDILSWFAASSSLATKGIAHGIPRDRSSATASICMRVHT